ncbi:MAG: UDP-3-O-acyl-N-acetylglucosamine deacetylase [Cyanobacteria bacterium P01_D01_bin.105]
MVRSATEKPAQPSNQEADIQAAATFQQTLASAVSAAGVGLHLGQQTTLRLLPAEPNTGRVFVRVDLPDSQPIPARVESVIKTQLSTELGVGAAQVRTVEHLLSALMALSIDNVRIEIDGPEVPLLDGSAKEWMAVLVPAGIDVQSVPRGGRVAVASPLTVQVKDAWVAAFPSSELRFSYGIDFDLPAIGNQWHSWAAETEGFEETVAPARTFGLAHQIDYLRAQGLIKGGSLDNALVCGPEGWLNPPLRFDNEPARHKLLDLVGDLSLLGDIPKAHYVAYKASHSLHVELAKALVKKLS